MSRLAVLVIVGALLAGCAGVRVKHHSGFMGPETWEATDGKVSVSSYRGDCWETEKMLQSVADKANNGIIYWSLMADPAYAKIVLANECDTVTAGLKRASDESATNTDDILGLTGAVLDLTGAILDIAVPDPQPVCDRDSVGVTYRGQECMKFNIFKDGTPAYIWRAM